MKRKEILTVVAIVLIAGVILSTKIGGILYFMNNKSQENSSLTQIHSDHYSVSYSPTLFSAVQTNAMLPPDYKVGHQGIKLIDPKYASKIGKKECSPSEAPDISLLCTAENQPGIIFFVLDNSINSVISKFKDFGTSDQVIEGKKFTTASIGAEGSGAAYYFYPLQSDKTLVIIRSIVENNTFVPTDAMFNEVIATLTAK